MATTTAENYESESLLGRAIACIINRDSEGYIVPLGSSGTIRTHVPSRSNQLVLKPCMAETLAEEEW